MFDFAGFIAEELKVKSSQVASAIALLEEGATVPFIARYRKEATGGLDDIQLRELEQRFIYLIGLQDRKETILNTIREQEKLTPDLEKQIVECFSKIELEDLYRPYRPARNTRAQKARDAGLQPLADAILADLTASPDALASDFINAEKGIASAEDALTGAQDILVETFAQDAGLLAKLRDQMWREGFVFSELIADKEAEGQKFKDYFEYNEAISKVPSHRALALYRGEQEGILRLKLDLPEVETASHPYLEEIRRFFKLDYAGLASEGFLSQVVRQTWRLRLAKFLETELFGKLREAAEQVAIDVFADNLKALLLAAPAGAKVTLALDPGFRSGVKVAIVDATGKVLETGVIYPHQPQNQWDRGQAILVAWIKKYKVELVAIGNGTASRETEKLVRDTLQDFDLTETQAVVISEAGASVYSASELAQQEFPELDVSLRGGISIGRRLQDPLAELVKIDPKSIGVGQYQHDVNQVNLTESLNNTVIDCVNSVGVDLNTASAALLSYVSGMSARLAQEVVKWRDANGRFTSRKQLLDVPRLGPKAFEQSAGFLRIRDGENPLDASAVHPESYSLVKQMAKDIKVDLAELIGNTQLIKQIKLQDYVDEKVGLPTLLDIASELDKPGRDPRDEFKTVEFDASVRSMADLQPDMQLDGVVTNVTHFGAFVDVGVGQDGLVHISHLADKFVSNPQDIVKTGDLVKVRVLEVDEARKRISLSMKSEKGSAGRGVKNQPRKEQKSSSGFGTLADKFAGLNLK